MKVLINCLYYLGENNEIPLNILNVEFLTWYSFPSESFSISPVDKLPNVTLTIFPSAGQVFVQFLPKTL